jgi:hypothetical protein
MVCGIDETEDIVFFAEADDPFPWHDHAAMRYESAITIRCFAQCLPWKTGNRIHDNHLDSFWLCRIGVVFLEHRFRLVNDLIM